jgi:hypothetical protein
LFLTNILSKIRIHFYPWQGEIDLKSELEKKHNTFLEQENKDENEEWARRASNSGPPPFEAFIYPMRPPYASF